VGERGGGESTRTLTRGCVFVCVGLNVWVWVGAGSKDRPSHAQTFFLFISVAHTYSVVHTFAHAHNLILGPGDSLRQAQTAIACLLLSLCCFVQNVLLLAFIYISMHTYGNAGAGR